MTWRSRRPCARLSASLRVTTVLVVAGATIVGCAGGEDASVDHTTITVLAAASLTESFTQIASAFEQANPGIEVIVSFGPSSGLVSQVVEGVAADVLATANESTMTAAVDAQVVGTPSIFATNSPAIAVPATNPAGITDITGLARPGVLVAMCEPQVPCGSAARQVIEASGLPIEPVTYEMDVKSVLSKVILDEVDAGMVFATDLIAAGDEVLGVPIPQDISTRVGYPIAAITDAQQGAAPADFIEFVLGDAGQDILAQFGFGPPP